MSLSPRWRNKMYLFISYFVPTVLCLPCSLYFARRLPLLLCCLVFLLFPCAIISDNSRAWVAYILYRQTACIEWKAQICFLSVIAATNWKRIAITISLPKITPKHIHLLSYKAVANVRFISMDTWSYVSLVSGPCQTYAPEFNTTIVLAARPFVPI